MAENNNKTFWPGWETVRVIGHGSFGTVYEIERDNYGHKEKSALKVVSIPQSASDVDDLISDGYDEESITARFQEYMQDIVQEYSLMADMKGCANIVYCDDWKAVQHDDGMGWDIFIRMELLTPLPKTLETKISDSQVIKIGADICNALAFCEKRNLLHRDIKPQNIFVAPDGTYKLGDFGIAKTAERTTSGTKIGTYKFMAPEVFNNQPYGVKADIYSLGLVLYWLLNERRTPFLPRPPKTPTSTDECNARTKRFNGEIIPAPAHGSKELQQIVLKACAYNPEDRFCSANDFLNALKKIGTVDTSPDGEDYTVVAAKYIPMEEDTGTVDIFHSEEIKNDYHNDDSIHNPPWLRRLGLLIGVALAAGIIWMILWRPTPPPENFPSPEISTLSPTVVPTKIPTPRPTPTYTPTPVATSVATPMPALQPITLYGKKTYDYYHGGTSPTFPEIIDCITQSYQSRLNSDGTEIKGPTSQGYSATGYQDNKYGFYYADGLLYFAEIRSDGITDVGLYYWDKKLIAVYDMSGTGNMFVEGDYVFERVREDYQKLYDIAMGLEKVN